MSELNVWRAVAAVALIGWAGTAVWASTQGTTRPAPRQAVAERMAEQGAERVRGPERMRPKRRGEGRRGAPMAALSRDGGPSGSDVSALKQSLRQEVEAEFEETRQQRRQARHERRQQRMLEDLEAFVADHNLDDAVQGELEVAMLDMHERMGALHDQRHESPREHDGPSEEMRAAFQDSFDQLAEDVGGILDEELADQFLEEMRPGPGRRRGGR